MFITLINYLFYIFNTVYVCTCLLLYTTVPGYIFITLYYSTWLYIYYSILQYLVIYLLLYTTVPGYIFITLYYSTWLYIYYSIIQYLVIYIIHMSVAVCLFSLGVFEVCVDVPSNSVLVETVLTTSEVHSLLETTGLPVFFKGFGSSFHTGGR